MSILLFMKRLPRYDASWWHVDGLILPLSLFSMYWIRLCEQGLKEWDILYLRWPNQRSLVYLLDMFSVIPALPVNLSLLRVNSCPIHWNPQWMNAVKSAHLKTHGNSHGVQNLNFIIPIFFIYEHVLETVVFTRMNKYKYICCVREGVRSSKYF